MVPEQGTEIKPRRIRRGLLFALGIPIAAVLGMGLTAALIGNSPIMVLIVVLWLGVVVVVMVGVHDLLWGYAGGTISVRVGRAFGSFAVGAAWLVLLGKAAIAMTPWALSLVGR